MNWGKLILSSAIGVAGSVATKVAVDDLTTQVKEARKEKKEKKNNKVKEA